MSSDHSILVGQLVPWLLDYLASLLYLGYRADQVGLGCPIVLHLASLKVKSLCWGWGWGAQTHKEDSSRNS